MLKTILLDGKPINMRASALTPKLYRYYFGHDIIQDMAALSKAWEKKKEENKDFTIDDLTVFERVAWLFAKQAGNDVGEDPDQWLDSLDGVFSVYSVLPQLLDLWGANLQTTATPKKK